METIKEKLEDIFESMKERAKSPFVLTFLLVWVIRHWELVYLMINFGADYTATQKLEIVNNKLSNETSTELFWCPLLFSFLSFVGYLLISLGYELIHSLYSKWGRTFVYFLSDRNQLVLREEYDKLDEDYGKLEDLYGKIEEEFEDLKQDSLDFSNKLNISEEKNLQLKLSEKNLKQENEQIKENMLRLEKLEATYNQTITSNDDFLKNNVKTVMYYLFKYCFIDKVHTSQKVLITKLFYGEWKRSLLHREDISIKYSENNIVFDNQNIVDRSNHAFLFKIETVENIMAESVFIVNSIKPNNVPNTEIIFKLTPEFYFGLVGTYNGDRDTPFQYDFKRNFNAEYVVQYEKIKNN